MNKRLNVLLVEDDIASCKEISHEFENYPDDLMLIGTTDRSSEAFSLVTDSLPDVVILDLELHKGGGDGLSFLKQLQNSDITYLPYILITTNNISVVTHQIARNFGADFIMTKNQVGYNAKSIAEFLINVKSVVINKRYNTLNDSICESETEKEKRIQKRLCAELNKVGISPKAKGYQYLIDAITIASKNKTSRISAAIANKYKKTQTSVERAMQNAINQAWKTSDINDLLKYYTARINPDKGVPTVTEFIYYYARIIKSEY